MSGAEQRDSNFSLSLATNAHWVNNRSSSSSYSKKEALLWLAAEMSQLRDDT